MAHPTARPTRQTYLVSPQKFFKDSATVNPGANNALLPLGALMLAVSVSGWAQGTAPTGAAGIAPADKSLNTQTVTGTRDRDAQSYQSGLTSVGKMPVAAKDIPQSLTVVNDKMMPDQGKDTFKSALENVIGIAFEAGEGGRVGDNIRLRGFSAADDIYLDGVRDIAQYNRDTFNDDRVEVLRGAARLPCCLAVAPRAASLTKSASSRV